MNYSVKELFCENNGQKIYGRMYMPTVKKDKYPLVICAHGFNANCDYHDEFGRQFAARGACVYVFDFRGGGEKSRSEGSTLEMSLLTEVSDLHRVYNRLIKLDYVDKDSIFLLGGSQGGAVAALEAAKLKDKIKGLMLVYPGFMLPEKFRALHPHDDLIPESEYHFIMTVGKKYFTDAKTIDMWGTIGDYKGDVYIVHGDGDDVVPIDNSYKAMEIYDHCDLTVLPGLGHGFTGEDLKTCAELMTEFLKERI